MNRHSKKESKKRINRMSLRLLAVVILVLVILVVWNIHIFTVETKNDTDDPYPIKGVDVSLFQKEIDWKGLESEGFRFAYIKATEGSKHFDSRFDYNWKEANKTDMKVGAYHFLSYDSKGKTQAENFIKHVEKKWGALPPAIDVEFYGDYINKHPSKKKVHKVLDVVIKELEDKYHQKPIIYTNTYIYTTYISGRYDDYPVWISNPDIPNELPDGRNWLICQYSFRGTSKHVANGEKYIDLNVFNGSEWDFKRF